MTLIIIITILAPLKINCENFNVFLKIVVIWPLKGMFYAHGIGNGIQIFFKNWRGLVT